MFPTVLLLFTLVASHSCTFVSLFNLNDDKDYRTMNGASQHQLNKDVKEDLKKIFLSTSQKYQSILIVREQQIYGFDQYMWEQNRYFANP